MACSFGKMRQSLSRAAAQSRLSIHRRTPHQRKSEYEAHGMMVTKRSALSTFRAHYHVAPTSNQVFPWRHESILPDRALERNHYSGTFNPTATDPPILRKLIAARELNIPIWNVMPVPFYRNEWEVTLANNFAVAFQFAAVELLRSSFRGWSCFVFFSMMYQF